nr:helix-turn-helix domain-containing protein [Micromonospora sp. DSM 115978]
MRVRVPPAPQLVYANTSRRSGCFESHALAISIAPHNTMLTTQEAADLLNISRPTLVRLLTDGEIPHTMRGRHRRVMLRDILDYRDRTRRERRQRLDQMAADAEEDGLYNATATPKRTR